MSYLLTKCRFTEADIDGPDVQSFYCGPARWEEEVANWIKSRNGVVDDIEKFGTEVWLYRTPEGALAGYASLGENDWSLPFPRGPKHHINYIPFIGVAHQFQGEPKEALRDDKFAYQILDDLIEYAASKTATRIGSKDLHRRVQIGIQALYTNACCSISVRLSIRI